MGVSLTRLCVASPIAQPPQRPQHRVSVFVVAESEFDSRFVTVMNHGYLMEVKKTTQKKTHVKLIFFLCACWFIVVPGCLCDSSSVVLPA